jgi:hypothetical protein
MWRKENPGIPHKIKSKTAMVSLSGYLSKETETKICKRHLYSYIFFIEALFTVVKGRNNLNVQ